MERMLMMVGWIIFANATVLVLVVRCTDQDGFASGAALLFIYPLMLLAATATGATGSVHAYWIGIAGVVVEFLLIGSMTMLLNPGVDAGSDPCTMRPGGWQLCATPDYSAIALYCGAGLIGALGIAGVVVEFLLIGSMTMLLNPGVDAGSDPCTMLPGGWQLCATPDYSAIALYCGAGLIGTLIGYGIGSLLRRHLHKADSV